MKLSISLVAVKKINSTVPRSNFSDNELNRAAELILKAEGIINPLVLCKTSIESYEVVNGHFEYYAATKAREIEPRKGEMIGAFIIEPEKEEVLKEQIELLRLKTETDKIKQIKEQLEQLECSFQDELRTFTKNLEEVMSKHMKSIGHGLDATRSELDYRNMTIVQLKKIAKEKHVKISAGSRKDDFIAAIKKADWHRA